VDSSGKAINMRVLHSLGSGSMKRPWKRIRKWKFKPGMKDGKAVTGGSSDEVNFRLL